MAVQSASTKFYADLIQPILDTYSGSFESLATKMQEMDTCKGKANRAVDDPLLPKMKAEEKKTLLENNLASYHTFKKTQEFVNEWFETLNDTHRKCNRPAISSETYETITNLRKDADGILKGELALATVNKHLANLIEQFKAVSVNFANKRVPEVASSLHPLVKILDSDAVSWEFIPWASRTVEWHHAEWLKNAPKEQKNWELEIKTNMADSASFETPEASFKELHEALLTLGLTYVDPRTNKGYGVNPKKSEIKISESLQKEKEEDISATSKISDEETFSGSEANETEENPTSSSLSIIAQNYNANSPGQSEEKKEGEVAVFKNLSEAKVPEKEMEEPLLTDSPAVEESQEGSSEKVSVLPTPPESSLKKSEGKKEEVVSDKKTTTSTLGFAQDVGKWRSGQNPKNSKRKGKAAAVNE